MESKNSSTFPHARRVELIQKNGIQKRHVINTVHISHLAIHVVAKGPNFLCFFGGIPLDPWIYEAPAFFGCFLVPPVKGYGEGMAVAGPVSGWFQTVARDEAESLGTIWDLMMMG